MKFAHTCTLMCILTPIFFIIYIDRKNIEKTNLQYIKALGVVIMTECVFTFPLLGSW